MSIGTLERPVRVAVIGAGPAGFFTAEALLKRTAPVFAVDLFERFPTPFGLVRAGVAPDHQKIKSVTRTFDKTAQHGRFRFLGNVRVGREVSAAELANHYDQVVYAVGSSGDRRLGVPGEELAGCHAATAFVGWYNGHPDFKDFPFALDARRAVVVGVGNVALDIARVLLRDRDALAKTDIPGYAVDALRASPVREVVLLARRGPGQVAFTPGELEDIAALDGVAVRLDPSQLALDATSFDALDAQAKKNVELMRRLAATPKDAPRSLRLEFLSSPVELVDDGAGRVGRVRVERNALVPGADGPRAKGTGRTFEIEAGVVFRSIGYFGEPVPGVPFDAGRGIIPNTDGRVADAPFTYAVGWIRRSATGVIGTNKADGQAVSERLVEDVAKLPARALPAAGALEALLGARGVRVVSFSDWAKLDALEVAAGRDQGKVREKFVTVSEMMNQLLRPR